MDANGWSIVIGAVFLGLTQLLGMWLSYLRDKSAARKVDEVRTTLEIANVESKRKLEKVVEKVEEVHRVTNSLTDRLVETTRTEAHAAGLKEGRGDK